MANNLAKLRRVGTRGGQFKRTIHHNTNPQRSTNLYKSVPGKLVKYDWVKIGQDIDGEAEGDFSGHSVSMNASGTRVAIGAPKNDGNSDNPDDNRGNVKVYEYKRNKWIQIGQELTGGVGGPDDLFGTGDRFGESVSMNAEGNRIAIGSALADGADDNITSSGSVKVYEYKNNRWETLGQELHGEAESDFLGFPVSMNASGTRLAISAIGNDLFKGCVKVYQLEDGNWTQLGIDIDGEVTFDQFGNSVSMNAAGTRVAVGAPGRDASKGLVKVYEYKRNKWIQMGQELTGDADVNTFGDRFGKSVSMNAEGNRIAIGSHFADGADDNINRSGSVQVYEYKNNRWETLGQELHGEAQNDRSGISVSMNAAGTRVAIGAILNDGKGHARVYHLIDNVWTQLGTDIDGEAVGDQSGNSVSMNAAGTRVAIGAPLNDGNTINPNDNRGHVRVYHLIGNVWTKLGTDIDGEAVGDQSGHSVSMNAAGTRVAIGANLNDDRGHVRIYEYRRVN